MLKVLCAIDFDGTAFVTNEASPSGLTVVIAYEQAIGTVFGKSALAEYQLQGGLKNGDPNDVVRGLWVSDCREQMLNQAYSYYQINKCDIDESQWCHAIDWDTHFQSLVELLVYEKLRLLIPEIGKQFHDGSIWPRPLLGFVERWKKFSSNEQVVTGIMSSGHDSFISQTFEVHDLKQPDEVVTNDLMRTLEKPVSKPDPYCLDILLSNVQMSRGIVGDKIYIGDDPKKDGQMALAAGWPFLLADPEDKLSGFPDRFTDWRMIQWSPK